ncbi:MAG: hypothetical protein BGO68_03930 [Candidatus Amoebophilus sp. 36-38]|nr:MAG: hypothetical protein BGO68_03930 [Candidatus Amoebophilus sp. 36-38]
MKPISSSKNKKFYTWSYLVALITMMCIGAIIGQLTIKALFKPTESLVLHGDELKLAYRNFLLVAQTIMATAIFILGPTLYWFVIEKKSIGYFFNGEKRYQRFILLTLALILATMIVNTWFTYWNMHLKLPSFLENFEKWAQAKEADLKKLTELLTTFYSPKDLLIAIFVIGIIPAIGEELVFRGILQNLFSRSFQNIHVAILLSSFIFSAIHLQLYGFLPRFLLGVLFGYLYWWTQNLIFPIVAHFLNNTISLIIVFLYQINATGYELENDQVLPAPILILFAIIGTAVAIHIKKSTLYLHKK